jgi:hypothetical protein
VALAVAAAGGEPAVLLVAAVLQLGLIAGWHRALGVSAAWGGILVGAIVATAADITVMVVDTESLAPLPAVVGATFLLAAVQQLARWDDRHGLVASMGATVALGVWVTALAAWPLLLRSPNGADWAAAAALAAGAASLARLIPRPTAAAATVVALGLGVGSGTAAALGVPVSGGAVVGAAAAMPVLVLHLVEHQDSRLAPRFWYVAAAWPFALAAPLAYLAARVVG